jgi:pre-mRNA-processing factor SLU7
MKYGTGIAGSAALAQARGMLKASSAGASAASGSKASASPLSQSKLYGEANQVADLDQSKVKAALQEKDEIEQDDRKRKYHSMNVNDKLTEEDMEAYRLKKGRSSDPMAKLGDDEVLDYK